ncbi:CoA transferase [Loigolactobacillus coryniformis]|jgi:crotonobetainyl-CoA:carnitine CoA-transferase CaiB-like acyl-CoA transferase|uniref:CaiB/BaiF CoA transferase family protein n=1 Tax=Loigolactobacillus coryniformis TaxID=1610 RepID=UPI00201A39E7|nr:CoA transferase [Loigolactobacillus coryniformis]MCL5457329.1 CoA transferase [Loigolactobacillus coryniformis]
MDGILNGVKVIDMTTFLAAPTVARILGEWGADVIKVESLKGDPGRTQGSVFNMHYADDENLGFDISNMNKRFVTLNTKSDKGIEIMYQLLDKANVFLTNIRSKSLAKMGLDYATLHEKFPELIFAQVLGYGENGDKRDAAGFDATCYMARGGILGTTMELNETPMNPSNGYGDFQVSMCLAAGICGALVKQFNQHVGEKVTVSLHHAALFMQNVAMVSAQYGNTYPKSRKAVANPFNNTYKTKDNRWLVMCVPVFGRDYNKVMTVLGRKDLLDDPRYNDVDKINKNNLNDEFIDIMGAAFKQQDLAYWTKIFSENDLPLEACLTPTEIYQDEEALKNDELRQMVFPSGNERMIPTNPVKFGSQGKPELKVSKAQGSDTVEVLAELGYSKDEVAAMNADGIVGLTKSI